MKEYERKYPQINPDSPSHDEALILRISARMKKLMSGGTDVKVALVNSVEHELTTSPSHQKQDEYPLERFLANGDGTVPVLVGMMLRSTVLRKAQVGRCRR